MVSNCLFCRSLSLCVVSNVGNLLFSDSNFMDELNGDAETLYIKCLFRTISFFDLKSELRKRSIQAFDDTYYIMCLKLRLKLLSDANYKGSLIGEIQEELDTIVQKNDGYKCSILGCKFRVKDFNKLLRHLKLVHVGTDQKITCQLHGCVRELSNLKMLNLHIDTCHRVRRSTVYVKQNQLLEKLTHLKCPSSSCGHQRVTSIKELKVHLTKAHADMKEEVQCVFKGCSFDTRKSTTLNSHFSKKHRLQLVNDLKDFIVEQKDDELSEVSDQDQMSSGILSSVDVEDASSQLDVYEDNVVLHESGQLDEDDDNDVFMRALAITFNTWANVKHIPYSTVNLIVKEVFNSYQQGIDQTKEELRKLLRGSNIDPKDVDVLISECSNDPFQRAREELESGCKRKKFILSSFQNVQPITVKLNGDKSSKPDTMQYIPLIDSLKQLLEDETYASQKRNDPYFHVPGIVKDVRDGRNLRSNTFFKENPEAIPLLLFQDELEVRLDYYLRGLCN